MNDGWYSLYLGDGVAAYRPTIQISDAFFQYIMRVGHRPEAAIFNGTRRSDDGRRHIILYFSPAASAFAKAVKGSEPCEKPHREGLALQAGDARAWELLFPEVEGSDQAEIDDVE